MKLEKVKNDAETAKQDAEKAAAPNPIIKSEEVKLHKDEITEAYMEEVLNNVNA